MELDKGYLIYTADFALTYVGAIKIILEKLTTWSGE